MRFLALVAMVAATSGCAHHAKVADQTIVTPNTKGVQGGVESYQLPDGEVRVAMMPMVKLPALWIGQQSTRAMHVRVTFDNIGSNPWTVYPRKQLARIGEYGPSLPAAAPVDPLVIAPGRVRVLDLFYPVPEPKYGPQLPSRFSLEWSVEQPGLVVAGETRIDPSVAYQPRHTF
jgi:hypothetical protein